MLSSTADHLYWMARHFERAENTARMLDVTHRMMLLPDSKTEPDLAWAAPWAVPLVTTGLASAFYELYPEPSTRNVLEFLVTRSDNPSSISGSLQSARENARSVRGAITSEMWECINATDLRRWG